MNRILRVLAVAHQPARKIVGSIEMRQHLPLEILFRLLIEHDLFPILGHMWKTLRQAKLFPAVPARASISFDRPSRCNEGLASDARESCPQMLLVAPRG